MFAASAFLKQFRILGVIYTARTNAYCGHHVCSVLLAHNSWTLSEYSVWETVTESCTTIPIFSHTDP
jgi:hypothetical protein